jgi:hypothetical protein
LVNNRFTGVDRGCSWARNLLYRKSEADPKVGLSDSSDHRSGVVIEVGTRHQGWFGWYYQ